MKNCKTYKVKVGQTIIAIFTGAQVVRLTECAEWIAEDSQISVESFDEKEEEMELKIIPNDWKSYENILAYLEE